MSARLHPADRGLGAVARVRGVRETDSRIGLQHEVATETAAHARVGGLEASLVGDVVPAAATPAQLMTRGAALDVLGLLLGEAREDAATAVVVTAEARSRWGADKARLAAVEHLLERRRAERRAERARREAREADDIAAQRWARTRAGGAR